eukprot:362824-Chlamydomonas_euryale.AAC.2
MPQHFGIRGTATAHRTRGYTHVSRRAQGPAAWPGGQGCTWFRAEAKCGRACARPATSRGCCRADGTLVLARAAQPFLRLLLAAFRLCGQRTGCVGRKRASASRRDSDVASCAPRCRSVGMRMQRRPASDTRRGPPAWTPSDRLRQCSRKRPNSNAGRVSGPVYAFVWTRPSVWRGP